MNKYTDPHIENSVLITIDLQNDFTLSNAPAQVEGTASIVSNTARLLTAYRKKGLPVVHVVRLYLKDGSNVDLCRKQAIEEGCGIVAPDSKGAELVDEIKPDPDFKLDAPLLLSGMMQESNKNEFVMYKPRWGVFYKTMLEDFLKERAVDTVVFSGCNFPNCPRTSIYEASERDFRIVLVKDAVSRLYPAGEEEMQNIGVHLLEANAIENLLL